MKKLSCLVCVFLCFRGFSAAVRVWSDVHGELKFRRVELNGDILGHVVVQSERPTQKEGKQQRARIEEVRKKKHAASALSLYIYICVMLVVFLVPSSVCSPMMVDILDEVQLVQSGATEEKKNREGEIH